MPRVQVLDGERAWKQRMIVVAARTELAKVVGEWRMAGERSALVPTMGALHEGHLALVRAARAGGAARVAVSIFVNPLQFDNAADLARYPVEHERDLAMLRGEGVDLAWTPSRADIYPDGHASVIRVGGPALGFEGDARPGHFDGVATVVAILFGAARPDEAWFGEKDWQQVQVVRRMVVDLALAVSVRALPTVREASGLALSSRNRFLDPDGRAVSPMLRRSLLEAASRIGSGEPVSSTVGDAASDLGKAGFVVEYLALVRGDTMEPIATAEKGSRIVAAARLGTVRLLDNVEIA